MSEPSEDRRNPFVAAVFRLGVRQAVNRMQTGDLYAREPQTEDHHEDKNSSVPEGTSQSESVDPDAKDER